MASLARLSERCKTRFVLPPSTRKLGIGGKLRALSTGLSRTFRYHEGLGSSYDTARRQMLARMDDEAYQSFVQSFSRRTPSPPLSSRSSTGTRSRPLSWAAAKNTSASATASPADLSGRAKW